MFSVWMDEGEGWFIHSSWNTEEEATYIVDINSCDGVYCYIDYPDGFETKEVGNSDDLLLPYVQS